MDPNLKGFVRFLEEHDLVEFDIDGNEDRQFTNRLKVQKYAFLAKRFGMPFRYRHGLNMYGPYSSDLAADYYALARDDGRDDRTSTAIPDGFRKDDFRKAIRNDPKWLEIAATLVDRNRYTEGRAQLVEQVYNTKARFDKEFINDVLGDLEEHGLVSAHV